MKKNNNKRPVSLITKTGLRERKIVNNKAFTLVEVLVSITIFSMISISIIWIYITSSDITMKSDINRILHENLKNVSSTIAEDIRKNWIDWVSQSILDTCEFSISDNYKIWDKLCTKSWLEYYLAKKDEISWVYTRVDKTECEALKDNCSLYISGMWPLTNSYVAVKDLKFFVSKDFIPKVTMSITIQPATKKWVKAELIKENKLIYQTTISERAF